MAGFNWAMVQDFDGPNRGIQFKTRRNTVSGSANFVYNGVTNTLQHTGSSYFNGFAGANAVGNKTVVDADTKIGDNYNVVLYCDDGELKIDSTKSLYIGTDSKVKIKSWDDV